jgi:MHS family proline/betaine transporter-like MFS transporter
MTPISAKRSIVAAAIGNALEWFDLVVYGFFAPVIADLFFPGRDRSVALLYALGTFGISFVVRPVGAVILGRFADRNGRRAALVVITSLMLVGTLMIAVLPTYSQIGVAAPVLLLVARLIQGFSAGGEFGSATAYLAEQSPNRRGFYSSWQVAGQGLATVLAAGAGFLLTVALSEQELHSWGWRMPFVFGLLIGPAAYLMRFRALESPEFIEARNRPTPTPRPRLSMAMAAQVSVGSGAVMAATVSLYLMLYMPTFSRTVLGLDASIGFAASFASGAVLTLVTPFAGALSDRVGRFAVAVPAVVLMGLSPIPLFFWLVSDPSAMKVITVQVLIGLFSAVYLGVLPAFLSELFSLDVRTLGLSLSYNLAVVIAGGFAPLLFALLVNWTGSSASPSFYLALAAMVSLLSLLIARQRHRTV